MDDLGEGRSPSSALREAAASSLKDPRSRRGRLLRATFVAMLLGVAVGWLLNIAHLSSPVRSAVSVGLGMVTSVFLRLIRMIVAPLVLSTLALGVSQMDGAGSVGKTGLRALAWFIGFSAIAILTGLGLVNLLGPGRGLHLIEPSIGAAVAAGGISPQEFVEQVVPTSVIESMAQNHILQIVVFAIFAGIAIGSLGERAKLLCELATQTSAVMMRIASYVMAAAPLAVFAALASTVLDRGVDAVAVLGRLVLEFYLALAAIAVWIALGGFLFIGRRISGLLALMREPLLVAFSTASSEATLPGSLAALESFGVSRRLAAFVLPLGYAFNLDGTMVYSAFAVMFIAQAYGHPLSLAAQGAVMLFLMLTSKGAAGVPRGGLLSLALTLQMFHLPQAGIVLILAVDPLMDMGRTAINVFGNAVATASIASLQGELTPQVSEPTSEKPR